MRLKTIVAEYLYTRVSREVPFEKADSDVRDYYCKEAAERIPHLIAGYLSNRGGVTRLIHGAVKTFIDAHGVILTRENCGSLTKRIVAAINQWRCYDKENDAK